VCLITLTCQIYEVALRADASQAPAGRFGRTLVRNGEYTGYSTRFLVVHNQSVYVQLESLRKDVECTFGILKSRFRILKTGIRLQGTKVRERERERCVCVCVCVCMCVCVYMCVCVCHRHSIC
jgi:hypothetical protein